VNGLDAAYQQLLARLVSDAAKDPTLLRIIATRPELEVRVKREIIEADGNSLRGRIAQLIAEGFFATGESAPATQKELARRGNDPGPGNTYKELDNLAVLGFLTIEQGKDDRGRARKEYRLVPGMRVNVVEAA